MIAFSLMSIIPLLVCVYLVSNFIFPHLENIGQVSMVVLLSITVALLGLVLAKRLVDSVIDLALEAKIIASGHYDRTVKTDREDEIGDLGHSINTMTKQIKNYMSELHSYSIKTKDMNIEIQRKIVGLSNLLQISDMIASAEDIDQILALVSEKSSEVFKESFSAVYIKDEEKDNLLTLRSSYNEQDRDLRRLVFKMLSGHVTKSIGAKIIVMIDRTTKMNRDLLDIQKTFQLKNCLIMPITVRRRVTGFIIIGNKLEDFRYKEDDIELAKILAKQIGIAIENDLLLRKAEEIAFKDDLTGLYNEKFIKTRLDEEIHRAIVSQRPCSFLMFNIDNFAGYRDSHSQISTEEILKKIANLLKDNSTEIGKVARLGGDEFAILLPEKNKKEAYRAAEEIRSKVEKLSSEVLGKNELPLTISGGVSENPIDGTTSDELFEKANQSLKEAKKQGKNKIVA